MGGWNGPRRRREGRGHRLTALEGEATSMVRAWFRDAFRKVRSRLFKRTPDPRAASLRALASRGQDRTGHPKIRDCIQRGRGDALEGEGGSGGDGSGSPPGGEGDSDSEPRFGELEPRVRTDLGRASRDPWRDDLGAAAVIAVTVASPPIRTGEETSERLDPERDSRVLLYFFLGLLLALLAASAKFFSVGVELSREGNPAANLVIVCAAGLLAAIVLLTVVVVLIVASHRFPGGRIVLVLPLLALVLVAAYLVPNLRTVLNSLRQLLPILF